MIPQNLRKGEQYYRNFRPLTRTADYPHRSIFAIARKKFQQITQKQKKIVDSLKVPPLFLLTW